MSVSALVPFNNAAQDRPSPFPTLQRILFGDSIFQSICVRHGINAIDARWLTNEQAAADSANFMAHVRFDDIDEDLTAPGTPWIYYGACGDFMGSALDLTCVYPPGFLCWRPICSHEDPLS